MLNTFIVKVFLYPNIFPDPTKPRNKVNFKVSLVIRDRRDAYSVPTGGND